MPKLYWIVSLLSIVTETPERIFHELKSVKTLRIAEPTPAVDEHCQNDSHSDGGLAVSA